MNRFIEKIVYTIKGHYPVKIGDQQFKGDIAHSFFWRIVNKGEFEPEFFTILNTYLESDSVYCDIGAWIGPTAMFASSLCKSVQAFEPDPIAYKQLLKNIGKNKINNIITHNTALSTENGFIKMASHGGSPGDSMSSMVNIDQIKQTFRAKAITWNNFLEVHNPDKIDFIKMDIEGGEFEVIPTMKDYLEINRPLLHLSLHPAYLPEKDRNEKLESVFSNLNFYNRIFNEKMEPVEKDEPKRIIMEGIDFASYFFYPDEL